MKKNIFLQSTLILIIGSFITRFLGFFIKMYSTRIIGVSGNEILSLINPTYSLLVQLATFSLPLTLSKIISNRRKRAISILSNAFYIMLVIDIIIIIIMFFASGFISTYLLHNSSLKYILFGSSLTLPFISLSSIVKGYFFGNQRMFPYMVSNVLEQIFRLIMIFVFLPHINQFNNYYAVLFIVLLSIFSESFSVLIFMFFLPKKISLCNLNCSFDNKVCNEILSLATPNVSSRIIGNIFYFFEPIILISLLSFKGMDQQLIEKSYALYNVYALTILSLPTFIISALSTSLVPELSKLIKLRLYSKVKKKYHNILILSLFVGIITSIFIYIFGNQLLLIVFHNNEALEYLKIMSIFFFLFYLEGPMSSVITALGNTKIIFKTTLFGSLIKLLSMMLFIFLGCGFYSLIYSEFINILYVVIRNYIYINSTIKNHLF